MYCAYKAHNVHIQRTKFTANLRTMLVMWQADGSDPEVSRVTELVCMCVSVLLQGPAT